MSITIDQGAEQWGGPRSKTVISGMGLRRWVRVGREADGSRIHAGDQRRPAAATADGEPQISGSGPEKAGLSR